MGFSRLSDAERTETYFDSISDDFESRMNPFDLRTRLEWFALNLDRVQAAGKRVLDVGCGLGHFTRLVGERGGVAYSLDVSHHLLLATKNGTDRCVRANALQLPFPDEAFDLVISSECVEHTTNPLLAIKEMVRVLRRGGALLLSTPNSVWRWSISLGEWLGVRKFAGIENWCRRKQVRRTLSDAGAEILVEEGLYLFPFQWSLLWIPLGWFNRHGQRLRSLMINQCWVAKKS